MKGKTKTPEKERAAARTTAPKYKSHTRAYPIAPQLSSENLKDQIGLLLWFLCNPVSQRQSAAGWQLLEVLYSQYISAKSGGAR